MGHQRPCVLRHGAKASPFGEASELHAEVRLAARLSGRVVGGVTTVPAEKACSLRIGVDAGGHVATLVEVTERLGIPCLQWGKNFVPCGGG
jgi:hydroxymethylglutaryl-CoA reductase